MTVSFWVEKVDMVAEMEDENFGVGEKEGARREWKWFEKPKNLEEGVNFMCIP